MVKKRAKVISGLIFACCPPNFSSKLIAHTFDWQPILKKISINENIFLDASDYVIFGAKYQNKSNDFCVLRTIFKTKTKNLRHKIALLAKRECLPNNLFFMLGREINDRYSSRDQNKSWNLISMKKI